MGYMLFAPEMVIYWAAKQHFSAKEIVKEIVLKYPGKQTTYYTWL